MLNFVPRPRFWFLPVYVVAGRTFTYNITSLAKKLEAYRLLWMPSGTTIASCGCQRPIKSSRNQIASLDEAATRNHAAAAFGDGRGNSLAGLAGQYQYHVEYGVMELTMKSYLSKNFGIGILTGGLQKNDDPCLGNADHKGDGTFPYKSTQLFVCRACKPKDRDKCGLNIKATLVNRKKDNKGPYLKVVEFVLPSNSIHQFRVDADMEASSAVVRGRAPEATFSAADACSGGAIQPLSGAKDRFAQVRSISGAISGRFSTRPPGAISGAKTVGPALLRRFTYD
ncbi:hypothetical protein THAOC_17905, partial [Thalassiosira oceanica]